MGIFATLDWIVPYFLVFLQVAVGAALLRVRLDRPGAARLLGVLFLLNAAVTALFTLPTSGAIYLRSDDGWPTRLLRAFDAPTGPLLLAFLALRSELRHRWPLAIGLVAFGVANGAAELVFASKLSPYDTYVRAIPYYLAIGLGGYALAGGERWERWVALALLPRGLYWGTSGIIEMVRHGFADETLVIVNRVALLGLTVACLAASSRLLRARDPLPSVAVPVLAIGPLSSLVEVLIGSTLPADASHFRHGSVVFLNLVTLAIVRPLVVAEGILPGTFITKLVRAGIVAAVATGGALIVTPLAMSGLDVGPEIMSIVEFTLGLATGLLVFALLEARDPVPVPDGPAAAAPIEAPPASGRERPQWQSLVLELQGSALPPGAPNAGRDELTQKGLVARTGMRASRVSSLVKELNASAEARLDAHAPGWRATLRPVGAVQIVHAHRGAVEGRPGVWLYYRLTPAGELLAAAIAAQDDRPNAKAAEFSPNSATSS